MKWNEWDFRAHLRTHRLNWARKTSWGWWDEWDDTTLQTQDSKFEPWWSEAEHTTSEASYNIGSLSGEETFCFFETWRPDWGSNPQSPTFQAGSFNHCTRAPGRYDDAAGVIENDDVQELCICPLYQVQRSRLAECLATSPCIGPEFSRNLSLWI